MNISGGKNEAKINGTLLSGFVISDKNGKALFRYQVNTFAAEKSESVSFTYPMPKLAAVTEGKAEWKLGRDVHSVKKGDVVLLRPGMIRSFQNIPHGTQMKCDLFEFLPSFLNSTECTNILFVEPDASNTVIACGRYDDGNAALFDIFEKIKQELKCGEPFCAEMVRALTACALVECSRRLGFSCDSEKVEPWSRSKSDMMLATEYPAGKFSASSQADHSSAMAYVINIINSGLSGEIKTDELAAAAHMSRSHFFRVFRNYAGMSVNDYILKLRVEKVTRLLLDTGCNILDAAYACGFTSSSGFYKSFKKITGCSPKEYMKIMKEGQARS